MTQRADYRFERLSLIERRSTLFGSVVKCKVSTAIEVKRTRLDCVTNIFATSILTFRDRVLARQLRLQQQQLGFPFEPSTGEIIRNLTDVYSKSGEASGGRNR